MVLQCMFLSCFDFHLIENFFLDVYLFSGLQTFVAPQKKIYVPPDVVDVIVTLKRGNLVKSYAIGLYTCNR